MSHCDLDIWRTYLKFTGLMHEALPIYKPSFAEIRWKIREKMNRHFLSCVLVTLIFDLRTSKCIQLLYLSLSIDILNLKRIGQKTPEKSCNASRTDFQRLSPRDLGLWPMALQMQMDTTFANVYTPAKCHHDRMKNGREIATSGFSILCPCDLDLWPSHPKMYTALLPVIIYHLANFEKDWIINGREIV